MKDITHYFVDAVKPSENSVEATSEVIEELRINVNGNTNQTTKKRGRVKIKISKSDSRGKICKIINSKDDLINKTPSPLPASSKKTKDLSKNDLSDTSICSNLNNEVNNGVNHVEEATINLDSSCENIFSPVKKKESLVSSINMPDNRIIDEKEESNAFQILMTRDKPIKSVSSNQLTFEEATNEIKNNEEIKGKLKKNKEKLVVVDKRGYSKRKLTEKEEEIRTEQQLENREKLFKRNSNDSIQSNSQGHGKSTLKGLHNYFTKIVSDEKSQNDCNIYEEKTKESTEKCNKSKINKLEKKNEKSRIRKILEAIEGDQILKLDDSSSSTLADEQESKDRTQNQSKKPRWSLRINLQSTNEDYEIETKNSSLNGNNNNNNNRLMCKKIKSKEKVKRQEAEKKLKGGVKKKSEILKKNNSSESKDFVKSSTDNEAVEIKILKRPPNEKLAPLFVKRPKPDPEVIAARQLFLHSRSPEQKNKKIEKKNVIPKSSTLPFPTVSHVTQMKEIEKCTFADSKHCIKEPTAFIPTFNVSDFKFIINLDNSVSKKISTLNNLIKPDPEEVLKEIEEQCDNAREMWTKISAIVNKPNNRETPKKRGRKKKSVDNGVVPASRVNESQNEVWTQKYRPLNAKEIIGNEEAAIKLKTWLNSWSLPVNNDDYSSSEEFYNSDNSRFSIAQCNQQVAVLLGPYGSGKTVSVYAIAEELGYNVLEVNASSKRSGRKILKDLDEATKSHRVKNSDLKSTFQSTSNDKKIQKNSLILFEDVDIIFDEDEGFVSAAYQLASNTKRPIVMTCRDSCMHLSRMAPEQLKIHFRATQGSRVLAFLDLITLAEAGTRLPQPCLEKLIMNGDLRKALLQLQYLLVSGAPSVSLIPSDFRETLWQDMRNYLYKPIVRLDKKRIKQKNKAVSIESQTINKQNLNNQNIIHNLANDLDTISVISSLVDVNDSILNVSQLKFEPSLSLEENMHYYSINHIRSTEIGEWLRHRTMLKYTSDVDDVDHSKVLKQLSLKKELNTGVDLALSQISMHTLDSRMMAVDYLPTARTICRAEELKSTNNGKRGNRFFHYLHNFRLPSGSLKPSILAAACKVMQEKH